MTIETMDDAPITPLQSGTIRAALKAIAVNALALVTVATGKAFDIQAVQTLIDDGVTLAVNAASIYFAYKTIRGRMNATATIQTKPATEENKQ